MLWETGEKTGVLGQGVLIYSKTTPSYYLFYLGLCRDYPEKGKLGQFRHIFCKKYQSGG